MKLTSGILIALIALLCTIGSQAKPSKIVYFPDPQNEGQLIPAYLDGQPPGNIRANGSSIHLYLITSTDPDKFEELFVWDLVGLQNSNYIKNAPLKVMSHGFGGTHNDGFPRRLSRSYLAQGQDMNIILIDWAQLAANPWYNIAAGSVKLVGDKTGELVQFLINIEYASLDQIHIIGFSLGAHVAGNVGHALGGKASRVTALDPALPLFDIAPDSDRIDPTDGLFVDVVHTAGGYLWENGLAFITPRGDADFYPNQGRDQPGCEGETFGSCSHQRAPLVFEEALVSKEGFYGCPCEDGDKFLAGECLCDNPVIMGQATPVTSNGTFYFRTRSGAPYALGKDGTKPE